MGDGNGSDAAGGRTPAPADADWSFPTPSGRARFAGGEGQPLPEPPDARYPLTLTTARESDGYNTGVRSRDAPGEPGPIRARVNPETLTDHLDAGADSAGGGPDRPVRIASRRGTVTARVEADEAIPTGMIWLPIHHPAANRLTVPATDPRSDEPNFKQCAVRLTPLADVGGPAAAVTRDD